MGNRLTSNAPPQQSVSIDRKRSHETSVDEENALIEDNLSTPKRKKLRSTSQYIYDTLFINGENSDVLIVAYGREWKLHKVYLCQAGYFSSMFSGSWKESEENEIHMDIPDENVDAEALNIAFGSLYSDEVLISATKVISVLAAATLLGLDGLIQQCESVMQETTSATTVCSYYEASRMYGQTDMAAFCVQWLERNLMCQRSTALLAEIGCSLMAEIVKGPDLFVMQVEMDVYSILKKWTFLHVTGECSETMKDLTCATDNYWKSRCQDADGCRNPEVDEFLLTSEGQQYVSVFRALRLQHIINDLASAKILEDDKIIPMSWLMPIYRQQWLQMVKVEQGHDKGPQNIDPVIFNSVSMRCGRILPKEGEYCWRWTGYNFGIDLLVSFSGRLLIFKRNTHSQPCPGGVSLHQGRNILYKLSVSSLDSQGHPKFNSSTGIKHLELAKDEESVILGVDRLVQFPLLISCQFLVFTPRKHYLLQPDNAPS